jgi:hypothetical protein
MRQQGVMKASITWLPVAGLNVASVECGGQAWMNTVDIQQLSVGGLIHSWCKLLSCNGIIRARSNSRPARPYIAR